MLELRQLLGGAEIALQDCTNVFRISLSILFTILVDVMEQR